MKPYQSVSCEIHSQYELLVIQGSRLSLCYLDDNDNKQRIHGLAVNLYTRKGEEYIVIQSGIDTEIAIRLDRIVSCQHK